MSNGNFNYGFGGLLGAFLEQRNREAALNRSADIMKALDEAEKNRQTGNISTNEFERQAVDKGILTSRERTTDPQLDDLTFDRAESELLRELGPSPEFKLFAAQIQEAKDNKTLSGISDFVGKTIGMDPVQLRTSGASGLKMVMDVMKALPSTPGGNFQGIKIVGPDGKPHWGILNKRTGDIDETGPEALGAGGGAPIIDLQWDGEKLVSMYAGPMEGRAGPGLSTAQRERTKRLTSYERQKTATQDIVSSIDRLKTLVGEGQPRGITGRAFQAFESATNQLASTARMVGNREYKVPGIDDINWNSPALSSIQRAAANNSRIKVITYNLALSLARAHDRQGGDIAARSVERELESIAPTIGGSDIQTVAALDELANRVLRELATEGRAIGLVPEEGEEGEPPSILMDPEGLTQPFSGEPIGTIEEIPTPAGAPTFNPKLPPQGITYDPATGTWHPTPRGNVQREEEGRRRTTPGGGQ